MAGIGHYGNCVGVATVGGEVSFDPCYAGNPLVNALTVGFMPAERLLTGRAEQPGDLAVLMGAKTGRDGIGGASVLASASFEEGDDAKRPNVQVGDPFQEKLLIEACLELGERRLLRGLQDLGAAGISCAVAEVAARAGMGMEVDLDAVPLREPSMEAWEVLVSESQERMLALVAPDRLDDVLEVCRRWGILANVLGEMTPGRQRGVCVRVAVPGRGGGRGAGGQPGRRRAGVLPPAGPARPAGRRGPGRGPTGRGGGRGRARPGRRPDLCLQALGVGAVRPLRRPRHRRRPRLRRGRAPGPGKRPGGRAGHRRQRPLHRPRPGRRSRPGRRRGRPQRRLHRRPADRRHQLPQLRQPRTARGDGLVRGRRRRHGRRLPGPRPARHRRQRQLLQRVVRPPHPPHPDRRRPRPPRGPRRRRPVRLPPTRPRRLAPGRDPGRARRLSLAAPDHRPPEGPPPRPRPGRRSRPPPPAGHPRHPPPPRRRPRPLRRRPGPRPCRSHRGHRGRRHHHPPARRPPAGRPGQRVGLAGPARGPPGVGRGAGDPGRRGRGPRHAPGDNRRRPPGRPRPPRPPGVPSPRRPTRPPSLGPSASSPDLSEISVVRATVERRRRLAGGPHGWMAANRCGRGGAAGGGGDRPDPGVGGAGTTAKDLQHRGGRAPGAAPGRWVRGRVGAQGCGLSGGPAAGGLPAGQRDLGDRPRQPGEATGAGGVRQVPGERRGGRLGRVDPDQGVQG